MKNKNISISVVIILSLLILYVLSLIYPLIWSLMTSLKGRTEFIDNTLGLPKKFEFSNITRAFSYFNSEVNRGGNIRTAYIGEMLFNSVFYAIGGAFVNVFSTCILAYGTARFNFKFSKIVYSTVIFTMILPIVGNLPSEIQIAKTLGLYDNMLGMWVMKMGFIGLYYLVFFEIFKSVPKDFADAAYVDGASNFKVLLKIMLPLVSTTFSTVMLIRFIDLWNDYSITMSLMPNIKTLAFGLFEFSSSANVSSVPIKLAGCFILTMPVLILFILFSEKIMGNISMGGLKE